MRSAFVAQVPAGQEVILRAGQVDGHASLDIAPQHFPRTFNDLGNFVSDGGAYLFSGASGERLRGTAGVDLPPQSWGG